MKCGTLARTSDRPPARSLPLGPVSEDWCADQVRIPHEVLERLSDALKIHTVAALCAALRDAKQKGDAPTTLTSDLVSLADAVELTR